MLDRIKLAWAAEVAGFGVGCVIALYCKVLSAVVVWLND